MRVETQIKNGRTITFIIPDNEVESDLIKQIARENVKLEAVLETCQDYMYPYIKIIYERVLL